MSLVLFTPRNVTGIWKWSELPRLNTRDEEKQENLFEESGLPRAASNVALIKNPPLPV